MKFQKDSMFSRRERSGRKSLWICQDWIIEQFGITEKDLRTKCRDRYRKSIPKHRHKQAVMPDSGKSWRYGKFNGKYYYDFERLPEGRRAKLPSKKDLLEAYKKSLSNDSQNEIKSLIKVALKDDYKRFLNLYRTHSDLHAKLLARACAVLDLAVSQLTLRKLDVRKDDFFRDLSAAINESDVSYLPKSHRRLKEKIHRVLHGEAWSEVVKLPRAGNQNRTLREADIILAWLIYMRQLPQNFPGAYIIRKVQFMCYKNDKEVPSKSWFESKLAKHHTKFLTSGRFGSGRKGDKSKGYIPIENALFAGDCWQIDGTRVNFIAHKTPEGKEQFLYIIAIKDVHSGDYVGWHFSTVENRWGYFNVLKMAANMTGYLPYEVVVDKFPGHNSPEVKTLIARLERLGCKVTITSKKTGKAKVERGFSTLQTVFMQDSVYYYGEGVQSRREYAHRSPEYLKKIQKQARSENWDFDKAWREAIKVIESYRNTPYCAYSRKYKNIEESPKQMHEKSDKPNVIKVEPWDFVELFGLEKQVTIRNQGIIKTEIQKVEYVYQIDNYQVIAHHKKVRLVYDMEDLGTVYLYEDSDEINRKFLCEATEMRAAQIYGPDANVKTIGQAKKRIKDLDDKRKAELEEVTEGGDEMELLLGAYSKKEDSSEAESKWLKERIGEWKASDKPRILNEKANEEMEEMEEMEEIDFEALARQKL